MHGIIIIKGYRILNIESPTKTKVNNEPIELTKKLRESLIKDTISRKRELIKPIIVLNRIEVEGIRGYDKMILKDQEAPRR